ncbi:MAG: hypothetical protein Q9M40_00660 [Sulfurimonas sp.]|nr:hypothetical protein [Sulfurimonas sp.]
MVRLEVGSNADDEIINFLTAIQMFTKMIFISFTLISTSLVLWQIVSNKNFAHLLAAPLNQRILPSF